jgi:adenylate cyclase
MEEEYLPRKLTAILSADVEGYSRLMGENEDGTVRILTGYRKLMSDVIGKHRGRVVDSPGDNALAEFGSVVDAVRCAVEIQEEIKSRNADLPESRRMVFRIGVNLGDVIVEGDRIYGDGVNIAARIEGLAQGGGICISGTVYDQIENKLDLGYDYLGEQAVKNIKKPIRVYRVHMAVEATSSEAASKAGLDDRASIAVLPFANISGDPEQEYFSDGMTEEIITSLSKIPHLLVIARNSTFTYKGKPVKVQEVAKDLAVRYVLEGSVRRAGERVRITAQLVDAETGGHIWAERYDREIEDVFTLQDEVTEKIILALRVKTEKAEIDRVMHKTTENLNAYDWALRGRAYEHRETKEAFAQAREMYEKAVTLDPQYAAAYVGLGRTYCLEWLMQWGRDPRSLDRAADLARRAIALDESLPTAYGLLGNVYLARKQHEEARAQLETSLALDPNDADSCASLGQILNWMGNPDEAMGLIKKAMQLNPHYPVHYLSHLGFAHFLSRRYEDAVAVLRKALVRNPDFVGPHLLLAVIFSQTDRMDEARAEIAELCRINPESSLEAVKRAIPLRDQTKLEGMLEALRRAGLKKGTP